MTNRVSDILSVAIVILFVVLIATFIGALVTGCSKSEKPLSDFYVRDYIDEETGVHYLIYSNGYAGGMSVKYNTDGTVMVD